MHVKEISTIEGLHAVEPEWRQLWLRCPEATPFQSPDWLIPWWRHFGNGELRVIAARSGDKLTGLAPLFVTRQGRLALLGDGISDYLDILLDPEYKTAAGAFCERLCDIIFSSPGGVLKSIRGESVLFSALRCSGAERASISPDSVCPVVTLPGSFEELIDSISGVIMRNYLRGKRMLAAAGRFSITYALRDTLSEYLDAFFTLHASRWNERGLPGVLEGGEIQCFHRTAASRLLEAGCLRLYGLRFNERIIALAYTLFHRTTVYSYLGAFDPSFKKFSPGTLVIGSAMRDAVRERKKEFDFLRGSESYKYGWGAVDRRTYAISFTAEAP